MWVITNIVKRSAASLSLPARIIRRFNCCCKRKSIFSIISLLNTEQKTNAEGKLGCQIGDLGAFLLFAGTRELNPTFIKAEAAGFSRSRIWHYAALSTHLTRELSTRNCARPAGKQSGVCSSDQSPQCLGRQS